MPEKPQILKDRKESGPLKIGVTGGIGAGKSLVCRIFSSLGVPVYNADSRARQLMNTDAVLVGQLKSTFGENSYRNGSLDRAWLAEQVFTDPEKLALLNRLVHPRVGLDFEQWVYGLQHFPYLIKEAALIFEAGSDKGLNAVVTVSAPEELRIRRTLIRDEHRSRKQVEDIIGRQLPEEERLARAGFKVVNDEKVLLVPQVLRLHKAFVAGRVA